MKRFFFICLICVLAAHYSQRATDGFTIAKIAPLLLDHSSSRIDESLLKQRYHYLAKGGQSYVFASEDGAYVLKFFRGSKLAHRRLLRQKKKSEQAKAEILKAMHSYLLADKALREDMGLVALHLGKGESISEPIKLVDKLGIEHTIDPCKVPFVIQKRAILMKEKVGLWMESGDSEKAKLGLEKLFALIGRRIALGIEDGDPNLGKNFGFVGEKPIEIDGGRLEIAPPTWERLSASKEDLQHFLNKHYPDLSEPFHKIYTSWRKEHETL